MLSKVKQALRITGTAFDVEITDLIAASRSDLKLSGVKAEKADSDSDPLITRAIITYCKGHFGWDNPDSTKLAHSYDMLKQHLTLSAEYIDVI